MPRSVICEQGDMGLWNTPLSEADEKMLREQQEKETEKDKKEREKRNYSK